jgi:membrane protein YdbS with pleckstrin-like domain
MNIMRKRQTAKTKIARATALKYGLFFLLVCLVGIWGIAANYFVGHWEYVWSANLSLAIAVIGAVGALFSAFAYTD